MGYVREMYKVSQKDKDAILRILKIRLSYIKRHTKLMPYAIILLIISTVTLFVIRWLIMYPYLSKLLNLAEMGAAERIRYEVSKIPLIIIISPIIVSVCMFLLAISLGIITITIHRLSKIKYYSLLDSARIFLFFSTIMCALSTILWGGLANAFINRDSNRIYRLVPSIIFSVGMFQLCFIAGSIVLSIHYYRMRSLLNKLYGVNNHILLLFIFTNTLAVIDIIFLTPFYTYMFLVKKRAINVIAYADVSQYIRRG